MLLDTRESWWFYMRTVVFLSRRTFLQDSGRPVTCDLMVRHLGSGLSAALGLFFWKKQTTCRSRRRASRLIDKTHVYLSCVSNQRNRWVWNSRPTRCFNTRCSSGRAQLFCLKGNGNTVKEDVWSSSFILKSNERSGGVALCSSWSPTSLKTFLCEIHRVLHVSQSKKSSPEEPAHELGRGEPQILTCSTLMWVKWVTSLESSEWAELQVQTEQKGAETLIKHLSLSRSEVVGPPVTWTWCAVTSTSEATPDQRAAETSISGAAGLSDVLFQICRAAPLCSNTHVKFLINTRLQNDWTCQTATVTVPWV